MIIKKAHIDGFGKWRDRDFIFAPGLQLIYGPNEAGKTTLMKFLISILFGFADGRGKNRFEQYIPKDTSSYGGSIWIEDGGSVLRIERHRGKNGGRVTVTDDLGHRGGEEQLQQILQTMDRPLYQALFSFGQRDLAAVDELDRDQWQQQLQQIGAVGSKRWSQLADQLAEQAEHLYKPRGRKWPLNQDLRRYQQLTIKINQARGKYDDYLALRQQLTQAREDEQAATSRLTATKPSLAKMERLQQLWPVYQQWQAKKTPRKPLLALSDQQVVKAQELQVRIREVHQQRLAAQQRLAVLDNGSGHLINLSQDRLAEELALKKQLIQLQAQSTFHQQQVVRAQKWRAEQAALREQYQGKLPAPLSRHARGQLEELIAEKREGKTGPSRYHLWGICGGFLLFILGLLVSRTFLTVVGAITVFTIMMASYYQRNSVPFAAKSSDQLAAFGQAHGLQGFPPSQWLPMQADLQHNAELTDQLDQVQRAGDEITSQLVAIKRQLPPTINGDGLEELNAQLDQLIQTHQQQLLEKETVAREGSSVKDNLSRLIDEENKLQQEKMALFAQAGVHDDHEFAKYLEKRASQATRAATTAAYGQQLSTADRAALAEFTSQDQLIKQVEHLQKTIKQLSLQQDTARATVQKCKLKIASLVEDGSLSQLEQERANLETQIENQVKKWLTYQLAIKWINQALSLASSNRYPAIIKQATDYFKILTGQHYQRINLTTAGITVLTADQQVFAVEELSQGTAEQLYVALRLGFVSVMGDQVNFPVIIDDGFVNFDNVRRQRMMELLATIAKTNQVLYFTADDRISKLSPTVLNLANENNE